MPLFTRLPRKLFFLVLIAAFSPAYGQNLPILVEYGKSFEGDLFGYLQEVIVRGQVSGDVGAFGSDVTIDGEVLGNISVINGNVTVFSSARISGNILCTGGTITIHEDARFDGKTFEFFSGQAKSDPVSVKSKLALFFAEALILFLFVLITFLIFPNQVDKAAFELSHDLVRSFNKGLITIALFLAAIFVSFLLIVVAIGFPLFLVFVSGLLVVSGFGLVAVCYRLAEVFVDRSGNKLTITTGLLITVLLLMLFLQIPILATFTYAVVFILGVGTVIGTRFGTNKQWFSKRQRFY